MAADSAEAGWVEVASAAADSVEAATPPAVAREDADLFVKIRPRPSQKAEVQLDFCLLFVEAEKSTAVELALTRN